MQPNQQNQSVNNDSSPQNGAYVSPGSANVPDFLHLDPIADPVDTTRKRKRKKTIVFVIVILLVLLSAVAAAIYWYTEQNTPQARLYRALENTLSVKYVNKKTTYHRDGTGKGVNVETDSTVDLTDPSDVSSESTVDFSRQIKRDGKVANDDYRVRLVKLADLNLYVESRSGETELDALQEKKWITSDPKGGDVSSRLEEFDISTIIYGSQLVPPMGSFGDALRGKIMDTIKSDGMFKVVSVESKDVGGMSVMGMRIGVDRNAINKLSKMIAAEADSEATYNLLAPVNGSNYEDIILWVDDKDTIVGVDYRNGLDKDQIRITNRATFTYPDGVSINEPSK